MTKLASLVLILAVSATAAPDGKLASTGKSTSPAGPTNFTDWKALFLLRDGIFNPLKPKQFNDSLFEYRWKSEWIVNGYVCTVEVRHTQDAEDTHTLPEINVFYTDPYSRGHQYTAREVVLGGKDGHVFFRQKDCQRIDIVSWTK